MTSGASRGRAAQAQACRVPSPPLLSAPVPESSSLTLVLQGRPPPFCSTKRTYAPEEGTSPSLLNSIEEPGGPASAKRPPLGNQPGQGVCLGDKRPAPTVAPGGRARGQEQSAPWGGWFLDEAQFMRLLPGQEFIKHGNKRPQPLPFWFLQPLGTCRVTTIQRTPLLHGVLRTRPGGTGEKGPAHHPPEHLRYPEGSGHSSCRATLHGGGCGWGVQFSVFLTYTELIRNDKVKLDKFQL